MRDYFKLPATEVMPDSKIKLRTFNDTVWKNYIFNHLFSYYNAIDNKEIQKIINKEVSKQKSNIETEIKRHLRNWLKRKNPDFDEQGFIVNLEPSSECNKEGFIDIKFEHSDWRKKYFSFEAKNLGKIKRISQATSINEYVYINTKHREDGGMFRYMTNKYACELNFGGMIGFVVGENKDLFNKLTDKIKTVYEKLEKGKLKEEKIVLRSIENNENTFDTIHIRESFNSGKVETFVLHHIIFDFTD